METGSSEFQKKQLEVNVFAGRLTYFRKEWAEISSDVSILKWVSGYEIPFTEKVVQHTSPTEQNWSNEERLKVTEQIKILLGKGAIEKCNPNPRQFLSRIFIIPRSDGSDRMILNLKDLNRFIDTVHFKLEDGRTVRQLLNRGSFLASIDLKDAYHLISVAPTDRVYLRFQFEGQLYQYTCLPFGLCTAPFVFTKLLKPVMTKLRELGYLSVIYLDDILLFGSSFSDCRDNVQKTCCLLQKLGFVINIKKSQMVPSRTYKYLGFIYDSLKMTIELPQDKRERIKNQIIKFSKLNKCSIREFAAFIGSLGSCCSALTYGWVYMKGFEREKFLALKASKGDFDKHLILSESLTSDFQWWLKKIDFSKKPISKFKPVVEVFSDASRSGWGVFCNGQRTHGHWSDQEKLYHINYLELMSAFFGLKCFCSGLKNCDVLSRIDNTTAIAYINKYSVSET